MRETLVVYDVPLERRRRALRMKLNRLGFVERRSDSAYIVHSHRTHAEIASAIAPWMRAPNEIDVLDVTAAPFVTNKPRTVGVLGFLFTVPAGVAPGEHANRIVSNFHLGMSHIKSRLASPAGLLGVSRQMARPSRYS